MSLYEQHSAACEEVMSNKDLLDLQEGVFYMEFVTDMGKIFMSGEVCFCWLGALGSGNFISKIPSKMYKTSFALVWNCLQFCSCRKSCTRKRKCGNGLMG